jgi:hypothetical protein
MNGKNSVPQIISAALSILPWPPFFFDVLLYSQMKVNKYDLFPTIMCTHKDYVSEISG